MDKIKIKTIKIIVSLFAAGMSLPLFAAGSRGGTVASEVSISKEQLMDKIKGGWAGQTIGCTYGGPTEFRFKGSMIQDYQPIAWPEHYIKRYFENSPGLYDDIYMDLTFVEVFERLGLDAPADSFAVAFANAQYPLWHANQRARYNILQGVMPPQSGHWLNNPHADDIDYQIEADYAGLMCPGMPNSASEISDKIGHIMNYGDGWYGGVFVGAMYSLAFVSSDIGFIVSEALKTIPERSKFYQCMNDVIGWHKENPHDWKSAWFECEKKWSSDIGCPDGVFSAFNIDAIINSAYIVIGLLYGDGDFSKTIEIATRCGQDSDCNPASAGGILGTMIGYDKIPEQWMGNLREVEDMNFKYTNMSLNKAYQASFNHALQVIGRDGGSVGERDVVIAVQKPEPVRFEQSFEGEYPSERRDINRNISDIGEIKAECTGAVFCGGVKSEDVDYVAELEVSIDGKAECTVKLPANSKFRSDELFWKYKLPKKSHTFTFKWLNPAQNANIRFNHVLFYSDRQM